MLDDSASICLAVGRKNMHFITLYVVRSIELVECSMFHNCFEIQSLQISLSVYRVHTYSLLPSNSSFQRLCLYFGKKSDSLYESRYSKVEKNVKFDIYIQSSFPKQILNVRRFQILQ